MGASVTRHHRQHRRRQSYCNPLRYSHEGSFHSEGEEKFFDLNCALTLRRPVKNATDMVLIQDLVFERTSQKPHDCPGEALVQMLGYEPRKFGMVLRPCFPDRTRPFAHLIDVILHRLRKRYIADGDVTERCGWSQVWPCLHPTGETLKQWRHSCGPHSFCHDEVKSGEMYDH